MISYGQGSTIGFFVEGDTVIDLDGNPFKVLFYLKKYAQRILIDKADLTSVDLNKFYGEIPNIITKNLPIGTYTMEVLYGSTYTSVSSELSFTIFETEIKSEVV